MRLYSYHVSEVDMSLRAVCFLDGVWTVSSFNARLGTSKSEALMEKSCVKPAKGAGFRLQLGRANRGIRKAVKSQADRQTDRHETDTVSYPPHCSTLSVPGPKGC